MSIKAQETRAEVKTVTERRALLKKIGRFAAVTPPAISLLLAATSKPAKAQQGSNRSSRQLKMPEGSVDAAGVLSAVACLTVDRWSYKPETGLEQRTHIGPYAEDFRAAFGVGDGVTISSIDAIGVCLAAIKALSAKVVSLEADVQAAHRKRAA
jgi:hypothetical protein